jgi:dTDP-4-dehydrorhamnose reductase
VDRAKNEPELAQAVNAAAPAAFAEALAATGGRLLQVSTDFVFNGQQGSPYKPEQALDPLRGGVRRYQGSRRSGGVAAARARVLRTSWVYSRRVTTSAARCFGYIGSVSTWGWCRIR